MKIMKKEIEIVDDDKNNKEEETYGFSAHNNVIDGDSVKTVTFEETRKRGPGRPPKNGLPVTYTNLVKADEDTKKRKNNSLEKQFEKGYIDNAKLLYGAIAQSDNLYGNIEDELEKFKTNRSYGGRNRMMHISNFMNTQVGLINTKVGAVRELNSMRNKINDLVLRKEQMLKDTGDENGDKAIMDAYYALINAPRYGLPPMNPPLATSSINTGVNLSGNEIPTTTLAQTPKIITASEEPTTIGAVQQVDKSFENYMQNLNPIQKKMIMDKNPNVKTVVVYNQSTGNKYFEVVDVSTGNVVPGVQKPGEFILNDIRLDFRNGLAVNSNLNQTYPLVITGTKVSDEL